jgi:hypothetical protein
MNTVYDTAKQRTVIAIKEMMYGTTIKILCPRGNGPENREIDILSIGPMVTMERADFRMGSIINNRGSGIRIQLHGRGECKGFYN